MKEQLPVIVGISGASGTIYGLKVLELLRAHQIPSHLVMSRAAEVTAAYELKIKLRALTELADRVHSIADIAAPIASGSFPCAGMIIAPCSVKSFSEIASGVTSSLLTRAGDVTLKERRPLVLMVRETPLHAGHLQSLMTLAQLGAVIAPPVPAFYTRPETLDELVTQSVARALEHLQLDLGDKIKRWGLDCGKGAGS